MGRRRNTDQLVAGQIADIRVVTRRTIGFSFRGFIPGEPKFTRPISRRASHRVGRALRV
jgi:hypothetical protein